MSSKRNPIAPPELAGYAYVGQLGSGGFADVFLYEREFPRQEVAIKVLERLVDGGEGKDRFVAEANTMASLSTHPYIVTIFHADISPEGHPYLVMEYYPGANYAIRTRQERFSLSDVLRLGVQVASAVEVAHRAGILHRDIKPANILTSTYGNPGLTDFGIAASRESAMPAAEGLSIPWSPPESLAGSDEVDQRSDVYSLAATLFTIVEGHSPFEWAGSDNRSIDLINRIEREPLPAFERLDVPQSLFRLLSQAMAKEPRARPGSAVEFARNLQAIEVEQHFDPTLLAISGESVGPTEAEAIDADAGSTRIKNPTVVQGQSRFSTSSDTVSRDSIHQLPANGGSSVPIRGVPFAVPSTPPLAPAPRPAHGGLVAPKQPSSASYRPEDLPPTIEVAQQHRRPSPSVIIGIAVATLVVVIGIVLLVAGGSSRSNTTVPAVAITSWKSASDTQGKVTWSAEGGMSGDSYQVVYAGETYLDPGSKSCGQSNGQYYCFVNAQAPFNPITIYRKRDGQSSPPATLPEQ